MYVLASLLITSRAGHSFLGIVKDTLLPTDSHVNQQTMLMRPLSQQETPGWGRGLEWVGFHYSPSMFLPSVHDYDLILAKFLILVIIVMCQTLKI